MSQKLFDRITERQKARAEAERDVKAYLARNPEASAVQVRYAMRTKWKDRYGAAAPAWLALLLQLLPLILKIFGIE